LETNLVRHAEYTEYFIKNRDNKRAATDSEKAREDAGD